MENITMSNITELEFPNIFNETEQMPFCNICLGSTDPKYQMYNMIVSGIILPFVAITGLFGNFLVVSVYSRKEQRIHSTSIYLLALGCSDFCMICTAMFLFVIEAWRHHGYPMLAYIYGTGAPLIFPFGAIFQTTSVYFCVGAAVDCFISVALPQACKDLCCTSKKAKIVVTIMTFACFFYNIPHFFEIKSVPCIDTQGLESLQICPTDIRMDPIYYTVYYTYMYTTFLAVGPLLLLVVLNIVVVIKVITKTAGDDSDTVSLILVVFFFIFCNFTALLINFLELTLYEQLKQTIIYLVDMSNLLVVINCTLNFFVYTIFGESFRRTLKTLFISQPQAKPLIPKSTNLVWHEDGTSNCVVGNNVVSVVVGNGGEKGSLRSSSRSSLEEHTKLMQTKSVPITNGEV